MGEMICIKNNQLTVRIDSKGAQLRSITDGVKEYLWEADEKVWGECSPVLFPFCGRLKEGTYTYLDQTYHMNIHGFAKEMMFQVEEQSENHVVFLLTSNDETRACYPFEFEFRVRFDLDGKSLYVAYAVQNKTDGEMYFSFGAHEGYACPEGAEDYTVTFPEDDILARQMLDAGFFNGKVELIELKNHTLPLEYAEFEKCTYVLKNVQSKYVILANKKGDRRIRVDFDGFPTLALWTMQDRKYLCIEPWCGTCQNKTDGIDFARKNGINRLKKGESFTRTHIITIM